MKHFRAIIKEVNGQVLKPEYIGDDKTTKEFLIRFWGLDQADVESYQIIEITHADE